MTRDDVRDQLVGELNLWVGAEEQPVTLDDLDALTVSIDAALDECRGFLESQFKSEPEKAGR